MRTLKYIDRLPKEAKRYSAITTTTKPVVVATERTKSYEDDDYDF